MMLITMYVSSDQASGITLLQRCRATGDIEPTFTRRKLTMKWTTANTEVSKLNGMKKEMGNEMYPSHYNCYTAYERYAHVYKVAQRLVCTARSGTDYSGKTLWYAFEDLFMNHVDGKKIGEKSHDDIIRCIYDAIRIIGPECVDTCVDVITLVLPKMNDEAWGKSNVCPNGLPLLKKIPTERLERLLQRGVTSLKQHQTQGKPNDTAAKLAKKTPQAATAAVAKPSVEV